MGAGWLEPGGSKKDSHHLRRAWPTVVFLVSAFKLCYVHEIFLKIKKVASHVNDNRRSNFVLTKCYLLGSSILYRPLSR